jgi:hypothetical protein
LDAESPSSGGPICLASFEGPPQLHPNSREMEKELDEYRKDHIVREELNGCGDGGLSCCFYSNPHLWKLIHVPQEQHQPFPKVIPYDIITLH